MLLKIQIKFNNFLNIAVGGSIKTKHLFFLFGIIKDQINCDMFFDFIKSFLLVSKEEHDNSLHGTMKFYVLVLCVLFQSMSPRLA